MNKGTPDQSAAEAEARIISLESEITKLAEQNASAVALLEASRQEKSNLIEARESTEEKLQGEIGDLRRQLNVEKARLEDSAKELASAWSSVKQSDSSVEELKKAFSKAKHNINEANAKVAELERQQEASTEVKLSNDASQRSVIHDLERRVTELAQSSAAEQEKLKLATETIDVHDKDKALLREQISSLEKALGRANDASAASAARAKAATEMLTAKRAEAAATQGTHSAQEEQHAEIENLKKSVENEKTKTAKQIKRLKQLTAKTKTIKSENAKLVEELQVAKASLESNDHAIAVGAFASAVPCAVAIW